MGKPQIMLYISKLLRKGKQFMSNWKDIPPQILKKKKNLLLKLNESQGVTKW